MKQYTYYFADGTRSIIQIEDGWHALLQEMDDEERRNNYNYNRHNAVLSSFDYEGDVFEDASADLFSNLMREELREQIDKAVGTLTVCQRELFESVFIERRKVVDIAKEQRVTQQAITDRLSRIKRKLQKTLASTLV